jgi:hypothetical protein
MQEQGSVSRRSISSGLLDSFCLYVYKEKKETDEVGRFFLCPSARHLTSHLPPLYLTSTFGYFR